MIHPARPEGAPAIAALLNLWIETSAITFNPVPKTEADIRGMIAGVSGENAEGRAFHERLGYRHVAAVPQAGFEFGRFMDFVLMQKIL